MSDTPPVAPPQVALVGSGYWGRNLVRNFHGLGALATVCETDPRARTAIAEQYPELEISADFARVLARPEIDAVAIATPASTHGELVRQALEAGKDVYVEKPLCLEAAQAEALVALARAHDRILMVGHLLWYHPAVLALRQMVSGGELGRIQYIYSNRLNLGKLRREENVLWSFAPHDVSIILGLLGEEPETVQASGGNFLHERIADSTVSLLEFASGRRAHIFVSWLHPFKEQKLVVVGERQMAVFDDGAPWPEKLMLYPHTVEWDGDVPVARKAEATPVELAPSEPLRNECEHFLDCVRTRATPRTDGEEGLRVLRVLNACQDALRGGGRVRVADAATPQTTEPAFFAHETAVIDEGVSIGANSRIWHFSHVLAGSSLGERCNIGQNVVIGPDVDIGAGCKIQNNVSVYKGVTLEDEVFCGPSMVFTNVMNPRAAVNRRDEFKPTRVCKGASIGANATIVCGTTLGPYCFIGAGAVVTRDVPAHALMIGNPARRVGWMSREGERLGSDLTCPVSGQRYRETQAGLEAL